ncbi:MAG: magnesium transporter [Limnochordia bacterium]|jgi:magnesium transporter
MPVEEGLQLVRQAIAQGEGGQIVHIMDSLHPPDQAEVIRTLSIEERQAVLALLSHDSLAQILAELEYEFQQELLDQIEKEKIPPILDEMASDDAADLLGELTAEQAQRYLDLMDEEEAEEVRELLVYPEETAGGRMTTEFVSLSHRLTAEAAICNLRELSPDAETIYYLYVTDEQNHLIGVVSLRDLIVAGPDTPLTEIMKSKVITVSAHMDQEEAAKVLDKYDFLALPVVDDDQHILGIITVDDVLDVFIEETTEDFTKMAAIHGMDDLNLTPLEAASRRLPWLVFLLFAGLLSGNIIARFESSLQQVVALATFIPLIADMGGNTGTQALAVVVRTLALERMGAREIFRLLRQEVGIGLILGTINGLLIALLAYLWHGNAVLGLVIGLSLWLTMIMGTMAGAMVPVLLHSLKLDPAVASGPFITTLNDIIGLFIYLTLANLFLSHLV